LKNRVISWDFKRKGGINNIFLFFELWDGWERSGGLGWIFSFLKKIPKKNKKKLSPTHPFFISLHLVV